MSFEQLKTFYAIAWDMDHTLVESPGHPRNLIAPHLHRFIRENPDIHHYIVTFRTGAMVTAIPHDLKSYGTDISAFSGVFSIPYEYWLEDHLVKQERDHLSEWGAEGEEDFPLTDAEIRYRTWKGYICHKHSIPVLVDDNIEETAPGCEKYSIVLIDPHKL